MHHRAALFFLAFVKGSEGWLSAHNVLLGIFGWSAFFIGPILIYISVMASFDRISDDLPIRASLTAVMLLLISAAFQIFLAGRPEPAPSRIFSAPSTPMGRRCTAAGWRR